MSCEPRILKVQLHFVDKIKFYISLLLSNAFDKASYTYLAFPPINVTFWIDTWFLPHHTMTWVVHHLGKAVLPRLDLISIRIELNFYPRGLDLGLIFWFDI